MNKYTNEYHIKKLREHKKLAKVSNINRERKTDNDISFLIDNKKMLLIRRDDAAVDCSTGVFVGGSYCSIPDHKFYNKYDVIIEDINLRNYLANIRRKLDMYKSLKKIITDIVGHSTEKQKHILAMNIDNAYKYLNGCLNIRKDIKPYYTNTMIPKYVNPPLNSSLRNKINKLYRIYIKLFDIAQTLYDNHIATKNDQLWNEFLKTIDGYYVGEKYVFYESIEEADKRLVRETIKLNKYELRSEKIYQQKSYKSANKKNRQGLNKYLDDWQ